MLLSYMSEISWSLEAQVLPEFRPVPTVYDFSRGTVTVVAQSSEYISDDVKGEVHTSVDCYTH